MLGAIIGDIAGSTHEVEEIKSLKQKEIDYERRIKILDKSVPLFTEESSYTDDTVLTAAIANALLANKNYYSSLKEFGLKEVNLGLDKYGRNRFSKGFIDWLNGDYIGRSHGNGCAMRISPIANYYKKLDDVVRETRTATHTSHNNADSYEMAELVSIFIFLAKIKKSKEYIVEYFKNIYGYRFNYKLEDLQKNYVFTSEAANSVPQAVFCFLESNSFEDAIRKAISIGGDSDTIAAITGSIAEAYYGIDEKLIKSVEKYLPEYIINIVNKFYMETKGYEPFKNRVKDYLKEQNLYSEEFFDFLKGKVIVAPKNISSEWLGCFPVIENNKIIDLRLAVPKIENEMDFFINVNTYALAFELYNEIEQPNKNNEDIEKKYIKQK